jgi:putative transposase
MLARTFGSVRTVWNDALHLIKDAVKAGQPVLAFGEIAKTVTTLAKQTPEREWLAAVSAVPLQQVLHDLRAARRAYFDSRAGTRRGPKVGPPRFKRKTSRQSARFTRQGFILRPNGRLYLAKVGDIRIAWSRELPAEPSSVTVIQRRDGRYYVSFVVEVEPVPLPPLPEKAETGIDLGVSDSYAVLKGGKIIANPRFLRRAERKLKKAHRELSRKRKGSKNRAKVGLRVARVYARVAAQRRDFIEQETTRIVRKNHAVYVESLDVQSMGGGKRSLRKSVHDASLGMFLQVLEAKCHRAGRVFVRVPREFPSTQLCSSCGSRSGPRGFGKLQLRRWRCIACGSCHDRDVNAEINIRREGKRLVAEGHAETG